MNILWERFSNLLEERNITIYAVQKGTSLSQGSLNKWDTAKPSGENILLVANFFDVSVDYLLGNTDNPLSHKNDIVNIPPAVNAIIKALNEATETTLSAAAKVEKDIDKILTAYHLEAVDDSALNQNVPSTEAGDKKA